MAGGRRGGRPPVPEVEVDEGRRQVPLSTFYSASQGQDDTEGSERSLRRARRPPPEVTDGARGTEEDDDEGFCEGQFCVGSTTLVLSRTMGGQNQPTCGATTTRVKIGTSPTRQSAC
jgi:hypothetical protein